MRAQLCWFGISDENIPVHITDGKCNKKGTSCRKRHLTQNACASNVSTTGTKSKHTNFAPENEKKKKLQELCRKYGIQYGEPAENESYQNYKLRRSKLQKQIECKIEKYKLIESEIPSPPQLSNNAEYDKAMDSIRAFELQQMSFFFFNFAQFARRDVLKWKCPKMVYVHIVLETNMTLSYFLHQTICTQGNCLRNCRVLQLLSNN